MITRASVTREPCGQDNQDTQVLLFNEGSIRDCQSRRSQWTMGRNVNSSSAFGPCVVPAGANGLQLETQLNGTTVENVFNKANWTVNTYDYAGLGASRTFLLSATLDF